MEKLSRRKLITQVSFGAGVAGVLAATAACDSSGNTQTTQTTQTTTTAAGSTSVATTSVDKMPDEPLAILVTDPARGTIVVIHKNSETTINNPALVQAILALP